MSLIDKIEIKIASGKVDDLLSSLDIPPAMKQWLKGLIEATISAVVSHDVSPLETYLRTVHFPGSE